MSRSQPSAYTDQPYHPYHPYHPLSFSLSTAKNQDIDRAARTRQSRVHQEYISLSLLPDRAMVVPPAPPLPFRLRRPRQTRPPVVDTATASSNSHRPYPPHPSMVKGNPWKLQWGCRIGRGCQAQPELCKNEHKSEGGGRKGRCSCWMALSVRALRLLTLRKMSTRKAPSPRRYSSL